MPTARSDPRAPRRVRRVSPDVLGAIAAGGALGAPARYGVAQVVHGPGHGFPWATFWTNVSGSFALGVVLILVIERFPPTRYIRPFFATGFLGAYTTFSTFVVDSALLTKDGYAATAAAYILLSIAAGIAAVWAGVAVGRMVPVRPAGPEADR